MGLGEIAILDGQPVAFVGSDASVDDVVPDDNSVAVSKR